MKYLILIGDKLKKEVFGKEINVEKCSTVEEAFQIIKNKRITYRFELIYVVIYIDLFEEYCEIYSKQSDFLCASIIFSENVYDNINKKYINDFFYNPGGITDNYEYIKQYINTVQNNTFLKIEKENFKDKRELSKGDYVEKIYLCISDKKNNIIIPTIMPKLIELFFKYKFIDKLITNRELYEFQRLLLYSYESDKKLHDYILPSREKILKVPYNILGKYFLYLYTIESDFYKDLNRNLTHNECLDMYRQYIYVLLFSLSKSSYESFKKGEKLYRGSKMSEKEYKQIKEKFYKKSKEEKLMFYCKNFLSFSKDRDIAKGFALDSPGNLVACLYTLTIKDSSEYFNNIDVGDNSPYKEREILFFPFSCFTIEKIEEDKENNLKIFYIKYLSGANEIVKNEVKNKPNDTIKKKLEDAFLNGYGKYIYNLFNDIIKVYDLYIKEETGIKIESNIPDINTTYEDEKEVLESFKEVNQTRFHINGNESLENILDVLDIDEVIYDVEDTDFDELGYVRIIGESKNDNDFLKLNKEKVYLIINGKKEDLCYKYKLNKGQNKIKFVFREEPTNLSFLFCDCTSLSNISALAKWKVGKVTDFKFLFSGCLKLSDISALFNWDVSNGINFSYMFYKCSSIRSLSGLKKWNVGNGNHFSYLFYKCNNLKDITGLKKWDVSNGKFFTCLFFGCTSLSDLSPLKKWNVSNGQFFDYLFAECSNLRDIEGLENWDVSNGNYFDYLFAGCTKLKDIEGLENWDVNNGINFSYMFYNCFSLSDITPLKFWDISNGSNFFYMFEKCHIMNDTKPLWFYKTS